ncbi:MAG: permease [Dermatophilaceae bacterium]
MTISFVDLLMRVLTRVLDTLESTWPFLVLSVVLASVVQVYVGADRLGAWLRRSTPVAVVGAVLLGALTPFCSCGTMAVVLGSLAASVPWAPVVAFMASSPLTSPGEYALSVGLFGPGFATAFVIAAIGVGLLGGAAAWVLERAGWLAGQSRVAPASASRCPGTDTVDRVEVPCCPAALESLITAPAVLTAAPVGSSAGSCGSVDSRCCGTPGRDPASREHRAEPAATRLSAVRTDPRTRELGMALLTNGRRLAWYFLAFAALGYLVIALIPTSVFEQHLGDGSALTAVPLAALLGIPMYVNTEGSLPLVASLMDGGMGAGPALAFLVTGAGTSIGAVSGMLIVARWRVVALVVGTLFVSACLTGWLAPLWL